MIMQPIWQRIRKYIVANYGNTSMGGFWIDADGEIYPVGDGRISHLSVAQDEFPELRASDAMDACFDAHWIRASWVEGGEYTPILTVEFTGPISRPARNMFMREWRKLSPRFDRYTLELNSEPFETFSEANKAILYIRSHW